MLMLNCLRLSVDCFVVMIDLLHNVLSFSKLLVKLMGMDLMSEVCANRDLLNGSKPCVRLTFKICYVCVSCSSFVMQRLGSGVLGGLLGPVMVLWFLALATIGLVQIVRVPDVLHSLSPAWAIELWTAHPMRSFMLMGTIVLVITRTKQYHTRSYQFDHMMKKMERR